MTAELIPAELRERRQWLVWRLEQRKGKTTKVPYQAALPEEKASSTDPATWAPFEQALEVVQAGKAAGVGYVLVALDPYCGIDLDDCYDDAGVLHHDAAAIVTCLDSYTERSQSGGGLHVLIRAELDDRSRHRTKKTAWDGDFEVYDEARFFCVTGAHLRGTPKTIEPRQAELERTLAELDLLPSPNGSRPSLTPQPVDVDDQELLELARRAKNGAAFEALFAGDWQGRYPSQSEADLAFCSMLAFWTGRDPERIDRMFRSSGLLREKWERDDYRQRTIDQAIAGCSDVYSPGATPNVEGTSRRCTEPSSAPDAPALARGQRAHRASLSDSSPASLRAELHRAYGAYLALEDTAHIDFSLAVALTSELDGDPVWGQLVGPPSSSKTEVVRAFADVADDHLDEISAAGLLSWRVSRAKWEPVGLLARHPGRVFATIGDFSTLLALSDKGSRDVLYALLRRAYDGSVQRELGNAPGPLVWNGRLTLLSAVTPAIDNYSTHADQLGSRWVNMRLPSGGLDARRTSSATARLLSGAVDAHREKARELTTRLVRVAAARLAGVSVGEELGDGIDRAAILASYGRGAVERSSYGRREMVGLPVVEEPPRLASQLEKIARGALALGLDDSEAAALCRRVALDSMPEIRRRCLEALSGTVPVLTTSAVARSTGANYHVVRRALEDLEQVGLLNSRGAADGDEKDEGGPRDWMFASEKAELVRGVLTASWWGCTKSV